MKANMQRNQMMMIAGISLLIYALLCPLFLTQHSFGIYDTFRQALQKEQITLVYLTVLKLVFMNCMRSIPIYLSAFLIAEALSLPLKLPYGVLLRHLIPLFIIPPVYFIVFPIYGIRYDFGAPAVILVCQSS